MMRDKLYTKRSLNKYLFGLLFMTFSSFAFSQNTAFQLDTIIQINKKDYDPLINSICASYNNSIYIPKEDRLKDIVENCIFKINLSTKKMDSLTFVLPLISLHSPQLEIKSIAVNDNYIVIACFNMAILLEKSTNTTYKFRNVIPYFPQHFQRCFLSNDTICFSAYYNSNSKDSFAKSMLAIYSIKENCFVDNYLPKYDAIEYTHFHPNNYVDFKRNKFIVSEALNFNFKLIDIGFDTTKIVYLSYKPKLWNPISLKRIQELNAKIPKNNVKVLIDSLSYLDTLYSRIQSIKFITDSKIFVSYKTQKNKDQKSQFFFEILEFNGNRIESKFTLGQSFKLKDDEIITKEKFPSFFQYNTINFESNHLFYCNSASSIYPINLTQKKYDELQEEYYSNASGKVSLYLYKLKL
jgi:hypothetical protein